MPKNCQKCFNMKVKSLDTRATCPDCVDIVVGALTQIANHEMKCDTLFPCQCAVHVAHRALDAFRGK
jgi:hypothetical protein